MSWFSKITQSLFSASGQQKEAAETKELTTTVESDRKVLQNSIPPAATVTDRGSTLSPFASRILEKAKIESLKDDEERKKVTSPAELFLTNKEAEMRIENIKSTVLEKSKQGTNKFIDAAKMMPDLKLNAFFKKSEKEDE